MANVKVIEESQVIRIQISEQGVDYIVQFSLLGAPTSESVKKANMTVFLRTDGREQPVTTIPAIVVKAALQAFTETKVEFAED